LRDVGIDSLRGPAFCTQYTNAGTLSVYTSFRNCQREKREEPGPGACATGKGAIDRAPSTRVRRRATSCGRNGTTSGLPRSGDSRRTRTSRGTPVPLFRRDRTGTISRKRHARRGRRRRPRRFPTVGSGVDRRGRTSPHSRDRRPGDGRRRNPRSMPAGGWRGPDRGRERRRLS
jgi:hypothetical protein